MTFSNRVNPRLPNFDYSQIGVYFITFCTKNRAKILCNPAKRKDLGVPLPAFELTEIGKNVDKYINMIPLHYPQTFVDKYIIMPNHVHILLRLECGAIGAPRSSRPTMEIPRIVAVLKRFTNKECGINLWQTSYYDHIIRDDNDYLIRWKYIDDNHAKWAEDEYYKER